MVLHVTVENSGDAFGASVRVRETRGGVDALFVATRRAELRRGANAFDVLLAPGDPSAGTALEIVRLRDGMAGRDAGEVVFRSALSRYLRPLARGERLIVTVGETAVPIRGDEGSRVWALARREMPTSPEAWASVDALVIGAVAKSAVSTAQVRALAEYVLGGGRIVFASLNALEAFELALYGKRLSRNAEEAVPVVSFSRILAGPETDPRVIEISLGLGRAALVIDASRGHDDAPPWLAAELGKLLGAEEADSFLGPSRAGAFVDTAAFTALEADRPFARAGARARTVAIMGALIVTVCAALIARKGRRIAACAIGGAAVAWAGLALIVWQEPVAAARVVRVRALSADGRAEAVADTAMLIAFDREATLAFGTETGPPLPVARRPGEAFAEPFILEGADRGAAAWRLSSLSVYPEEPFFVRATSAREVGPDGERMRAHVIENGTHVRVTTLPGGGRKLSADCELPRDVGYLLERFAPQCDGIAWVWVDGAPEGALAPGCDLALGSGTLVIAAVPAPTRASD
jgi:hypothetical protein